MHQLLSVDQLMKNQLLKHFSVIEKRTVVKVIPNPINLEEIRIKAEEKSESNIPDNFIVTAGRLIEEKGYDILINAFNKVKQNQKNLKLIILGKGKLQEDLEMQAIKLNLENDIVFAGHVSNVYTYFKKLKAFLMCYYK